MPVVSSHTTGERALACGKQPYHERERERALACGKQPYHKRERERALACGKHVPGRTHRTVNKRKGGRAGAGGRVRKHPFHLW